MQPVLWQLEGGKYTLQAQVIMTKSQEHGASCRHMCTLQFDYALRKDLYVRFASRCCYLQLTGHAVAIGHGPSSRMVAPIGRGSGRSRTIGRKAPHTSDRRVKLKLDKVDVYMKASFMHALRTS